VSDLRTAVLLNYGGSVCEDERGRQNRVNKSLVRHAITLNHGEDHESDGNRHAEPPLAGTAAALPASGSPSDATALAAPGKFESKRFCSDKKVILRGYVTFTHIFVVLYMKEPSHANSQTALSR
jgi:hypothetical protein